MPDTVKFNNPWLIAVWPGMGHVAISAGYYLMAKLGMHLLAELSASELFEIEHVEVKDGLIHTGQLPRSRFFIWNDPRGKHDIILFIGEAQPPIGKHTFCRRLIEYARGLGVERVFTFAAMATQMHPEHDSRVYAAATDEAGLAELKRLELAILEEGRISGLNGVLLGVAAESGLRGACLLGEMPHIFAQLPFPKASLAVLEAFTTLADVEIDFAELSQQAKTMEQKLGELLAQLEKELSQQRSTPLEEETSSLEPAKEEGLSLDDQQHIETLFEQAQQDRTKAYELKQELDRLGVFKEYENRFLDLFKRP